MLEHIHTKIVKTIHISQHYKITGKQNKWSNIHAHTYKWKQRCDEQRSKRQKQKWRRKWSVESKIKDGIKRRREDLIYNRKLNWWTEFMCKSKMHYGYWQLNVFLLCRTVLFISVWFFVWLFFLLYTLLLLANKFSKEIVRYAIQ